MPPFTTAEADTAVRSFNWLLAAVFLSAVGRNAYNVACSWLLVVSGHGHGVSSVTAFFAVSSVIELIASPICGWMSDHYNRRHLAIIADAIRVATAIALGVMMVAADDVWPIWISTIVFATCDRLSLTALQSMIPSSGARYSLATANSIAFFFMQLGSLVAAALIGLILFASTTMTAFIAIAGFFTVSVFCVAVVGNERRGLRKNYSLACKSLSMNVPLIRLCLIYSLLYSGGLLISAIGPSFVFEELGGNALDFGRLESAWSAGSILGAILLIPMIKLIKLSALHLIILTVTALLFALIKTLDFPIVLLAFGLIGGVYNLGRVAIEVSLQSSVPCNALGRAKGCLHGSGVLLSLILLGIVALVSRSISPSTIFLAFSVLIASGTVIVASVCTRGQDKD